jgi:hypothetical protein
MNYIVLRCGAVGNLQAKISVTPCSLEIFVIIFLLDGSLKYQLHRSHDSVVVGSVLESNLSFIEGTPIRAIKVCKSVKHNNQQIGLIGYGPLIGVVIR